MAVDPGVHRHRLSPKSGPRDPRGEDDGGSMVSPGGPGGQEHLEGLVRAPMLPDVRLVARCGM